MTAAAVKPRYSIPMTPLHAVCVHGIGHRTPSNFADKAMKRLSAALEPRGVRLYARSVHWGPILDAPQEKLLKQLQKYGSKGRPIQRIAVESLADALSYRDYQTTINHLFHYEISRLKATGPVLFFAHSLGVVLTTDYLRANPEQPARLVSFGTNLNLFNIGSMDTWACPPQLAGVGKWTNIFSDTDALGFPLRGWLPQVRDVEENVGGLLTRWNGASHGAYWTDASLWSKTMPGLLPGR